MEGQLRDYIQALFKLDSTSSVKDALVELETLAPFRLRIKVLYSSSSPTTVFEKLANRGEISHLGPRSNSYTYNTTVGREHKRELSVPFFVASFESLGGESHTEAIVSVCKRDEWNALRRYTQHKYPSLVPVLLSQGELIETIQLLRSHTEHSINVKAFSAKERLSKREGRASKSIREWTNEELNEAIQVIRERNQIVTAFEVEFYPHIGRYSHVQPRAVCNLRKNGEIEVTGSFRLAFDTVATHVAGIGEKKLHTLSSRGLRDSQYQSQPIKIDFSGSLFSEKEQVQFFVGVLKKYPHSMYAINHGNPYAHIKLTDLLDGSSLDVYAVPPQHVTLIPGLKTTEASLQRLIHYIYDSFHEGNVVNRDRD
ncbi:hypothetical protein ACFL45_09515 [Candidatus Neomarinimicrobiota bacterium]